jgi:hypothetical protein
MNNKRKEKRKPVCLNITLLVATGVTGSDIPYKAQL